MSGLLKDSGVRHITELGYENSISLSEGNWKNFIIGLLDMKIHLAGLVINDF